MKISRGVVLFAVVSAVALAGCGDRSGAGGETAITPRAIAAVMLDHLPDDTTRRAATYVDETSPPGYVGADFRYGGDGESDGDLVRVTLQRGGDLPSCQDGGCARLGNGVRLLWEEEAPEEDPGIVLLARRHDDAVVEVLLAGPKITGDPRRQALDPSVEALTELLTDSRLALTASAETVAAGRGVSRWGGGERDPVDLEQVPNDDRTVVTGFIYGWGDDWEYVGSAPGKGMLGPEAIGGRVRLGGGMGPVGPGFLDALAAPEPPEWLDSCLPEFQCWSRGADHFVWRPVSGKDPGEAWMVHVNDSGETVALHTVGRRLSEKRQQALGASGYFAYGQSFYDRDDPLSVGLTTTRERFEQASRIGG